MLVLTDVNKKGDRIKLDKKPVKSKRKEVTEMNGKVQESMEREVEETEEKKDERIELLINLVTRMKENQKEHQKYMVERMEELCKEVKNCKQENEKLNKEIQELRGKGENEYKEIKKILRADANTNTNDKDKRSYSQVAKENKQESIIVYKPKTQQKSEETEKAIKEKVNIRNMNMGISNIRKGKNGTIILGCDKDRDIQTLKETVTKNLGDSYNVTQPISSKPKMKIANIGKDEFEMEGNELMESIRKQNGLDTGNEGFHMRILKRIRKMSERGATRTPKDEGSIIVEVDINTQDAIMKEKRLNIGWRKCPVYEHFSVKRCFKCWGFYHIAKNCTKTVTCHGCAGNHTSNECVERTKKCVNCIEKMQKYNIKINAEHNALSSECPTYQRALREKRRRTDTSKDE
ncbi:uveal autoantigen with coiled-coil domains and ankyrin repeats protein-like [Pseudomyrmex gracilis]|uniref:uveal autoantigen with coiled-coil domains and ankyrin repeats protein-like n=1 Tax=Pseudomyrmex gracilis TaxID=219809 RepID=UPI000995511A|nr:uveal autoantigen with coiled-coil domains and ankyrin repeats protein-like [Pseudomyrmex gracilis]